MMYPVSNDPSCALALCGAFWLVFDQVIVVPGATVISAGVNTSSLICTALSAACAGEASTHRPPVAGTTTAIRTTIGQVHLRIVDSPFARQRRGCSSPSVFPYPPSPGVKPGPRQPDSHN